VKERAIAAILLSLPPLYVTVVLLPSLASGDLAVAGAFAFTVLLAGSVARPGAAPWRITGLLAILFVAAIGVAAAAEGPAGPFPLALVAGALIGLPWVASVPTWRPRVPLGFRCLALGVIVLLGLLYLADAQALQNSGTCLNGGNFVSQLGATNVAQAQGLASLFLPGPLTPPVAALFDPAFALLTGLALLGLLVLIVRPQTGEEAPLPIALRAGVAPEPDLPELYGFSPEQRAAYRQRSRADPPGVPWPPGLDAVVVAAFASALFVGIAFASPYYAVFAVVVGLVGAVVAVLVATDRPAPFELPDAPVPVRRAPTPQYSAPGPPAPPPRPPPSAGG